MLKSNIAAGILWMCLTMLLNSIGGACIRKLAGSIPAMELVFFRSVFGLLMLTPWIWSKGLSSLKTTQLPLHCFRVFFASSALVLLFYALGEMPIADVFALQFTIPLFTIILAVFILKQRADAHAWCACIIGFCGALIVMRPGFIELTLASVCAIISAFLSGGSNTTLKMLSRTEGAGVITVYSNLLMLPLALIPMLFIWVMPTAEQWPLVLTIAVLNAVSGYCFTRSVGAADARIVQPFQFTRMIFATAIGFWMFAEFPDLWTWVGAAVIFGASYYIVWRETKPNNGYSSSSESNPV